MLLKLNKTIPNLMLLYGELGCYPLKLFIHVIMICFWHRLVTSDTNKVSTYVYKRLLTVFKKDKLSSNWLKLIENILNNAGLSDVFISQGVNVNSRWLSLK